MTGNEPERYGSFAPDPRQLRLLNAIALTKQRTYGYAYPPAVKQSVWMKCLWFCICLCKQ